MFYFIEHFACHAQIQYQCVIIHFILWKESFFGVPVHSVSPHFMCLFPLRKFLRASLGEENRVSVVRGGQCPWDGEEENNQCKFKSSHPLLGLWGAAAITPPSLFSEIPQDCSSPHQSSHSLSPFNRGRFHHFLSWWKSSLRFVCPAINFSCFNTSPYFPPGEPPSQFQSILLGIENSGSRKPSLGWLALSYVWP